MKKVMTLLTDNGKLDYQPVQNIIITTTIGSFTLLSALQFRDFITQLIELLTPQHAIKKLLFTLVMTLLFTLIGVSLAYHYQDLV